MRAVRVRRDPGPGPSLAWGLLLVVIVVVGLGGRVLEPPLTGVLLRPSGSPVAGADGRPGPLQLVEPRPDLFWHATGLIPVRGRTTLDRGRLLVVVRSGGRVIGRATLTVRDDGRIRGAVPIRPPVEPASGVLSVVDAGPPRRVLATVSLDLEAGSPILLWAPTDPDRPIRSRSVHVRGPIVTPVDRVVARLTMRGGETVALEEVVATDRETFDLQIDLPDRLAPGKAWLHVSAFRHGQRMEVAHLDMRLRLEPTDRP